MLTFSEMAAVIAVWALLLVGVFFAGRAAWRRRRPSDEVREKNGAAH